MMMMMLLAAAAVGFLIGSGRGLRTGLYLGASGALIRLTRRGGLTRGWDPEDLERLIQEVVAGG